MRISGVDNVDKTWLTCCALHNWLLKVDGLNGEWKGEVLLSDWEGEMGGLDFDGLQSCIPNTIARLCAKLDPRNYNLSGIGPGEDDTGESHDSDKGIDDGIVGFLASVKDLSLLFIVRQLVDHFTIMFLLNKNSWP
jgi:hypothetical protein